MQGQRQRPTGHCPDLSARSPGTPVLCPPAPAGARTQVGRYSLSVCVAEGGTGQALAQPALPASTPPTPTPT